MKKEFKKPELRRISLNINENIARSEPPGHVGIYKVGWPDASSCPIWETNPPIYWGGITEGNIGATFYCLDQGVSLQSAARTLGIGL